jgi:hypothetical protein
MLLFAFTLRPCAEFIALTRRLDAGYVVTAPSFFEIAAVARTSTDKGAGARYSML